MLQVTHYLLHIVMCTYGTLYDEHVPKLHELPESHCGDKW